MNVRWYGNKYYLLPSTKQLNALNNIGALLKGVLTDLLARNIVHARIFLCLRCVHTHYCVHNLSSPIATRIYMVKSLLISVALEKTIDIVLQWIYLHKKIATILNKKEMKNLLILCTQNVHFTLSKEICIQNHGVVMGLPLSPTLAGSFMAQLENTLVPKLK